MCKCHLTFFGERETQMLQHGLQEILMVVCVCGRMYAETQREMYGMSTCTRSSTPLTPPRSSTPPSCFGMRRCSLSVLCHHDPASALHQRSVLFSVLLSSLLIHRYLAHRPYLYLYMALLHVLGPVCTKGSSCSNHLTSLLVS